MLENLLARHNQIKKLRACTGWSSDKAGRMLKLAEETGIPADVYIKDGYWYVPEEFLQLAWDERSMRQKQAKMLIKARDKAPDDLIRKMLEAEYTLGIRPSNYRKYSWDLISEKERKTILVPVNTTQLSEKYDKPDFRIDMLIDKREFYKAFDDMLGRRWLIFDESNPGKEWFIKEVGRLKTEKLIIKPSMGHRGKEVTKISNPATPEEAGRLFEELTKEVATITNEAAKGTFLENEEGSLLIEECISQSEPMSVLNRSSINTIRTVVLCTDTIEKVLYAACRMGQPGAETDNVGRGGKTAAVDAETGVITTPAIGRKNEEYHTFPDSDIDVRGYQLPMWDKVIDLSLRASRRLYEVAGKAFSGWDIAVTDDGPVLIEGNNAPSPNLAQRPLWVCNREGIRKVVEPYL